MPNAETRNAHAQFRRPLWPRLPPRWRLHGPIGSAEEVLRELVRAAGSMPHLQSLLDEQDTAAPAAPEPGTDALEPAIEALEPGIEAPPDYAGSADRFSEFWDGSPALEPEPEGRGRSPLVILNPMAALLGLLTIVLLLSG